MDIKHRKFLLLLCAGTLFSLGDGLAAEPSVQIDIEGVSGIPLQNVQAALELPPGIVREGRVEERWLARHVDQIPQLAATALEPFGRYGSLTSISQEQTGESSYRILVKIDPGPQTVVSTLTVRVTGDGGEETELRRLAREFPLQQGDPLDHRLYEQGKLNLRLAANELGYLEAAFTSHVIRVTPREHAADIELVLETGGRFYFGKTSFVEAGERFGEDFLRRFLTYRPGEVFSYKELHRSRLGFYGANRFNDVQMVPLMDDTAGQQVPVRVDLTAGKQQRLRPGIGYGTNTGARLTLNYQNMQVGETAHAYAFNLNLSERAQFFESSYTIPQAGSADNNLIGTVGLRQEDLNTYQTQMIYAEGEQTYGLGRGKRGSLFLRFLREDSDVGSDNNIAQLFIPGARYYQRSYDDPLQPSSGYQFRVEVRGSHDTLLSDVNLAQVIAAGSFMLPLSDRLTLHTRAEAATTIKDDELSQVPPSLRFFVGGDSSVRGYAYRSRGPRDEFGDVVGGDSLLAGSIEGEYALSDQWGLALFYDAGSAFNASHDLEVIQGAGIGIRRYTPVGPIKFDLAGRIGDDERGFRLHLSVGFEI